MIVTEREEVYGPADVNITRVASLWSAYLQVNVSPHDVAQMMVLMKISRSKFVKHDDNYTDAIGYTQIAQALR